MASRGYVHPFDRTMNFSSWIHKPDRPAPEGYEYVQYETENGNLRWKLKKLDSKELLSKNGPEAIKNLLKVGVEPGTKGKLISDIATTAIDIGTGNV